MTRRIIGIALTALLALTQAAPLMAAMCGRKAMDCCDGVMCPMPKKHSETSPSSESMQQCAPGAEDENAATCTASPCAPKSSAAIHASTYLLCVVLQVSRDQVIESACRSFEPIQLAISVVPEPPPPKIIFS